MLTAEQKAKITDLTTAESITRVRRKLREQFPGSDIVEQGRYRKFQEYTDEYGQRVMRML